MRLATNTNLIAFNRNGTKTEMPSLIPRYARGGFTTLDTNLCEMLNPTNSLLKEDWPVYVRSILELKKGFDLIYNQAHAPYGLTAEALHPLFERSLEICAVLGIPVLVVHPFPTSVEENVAAFTPYIARAGALGISLAFENLNKEGELTELDDLVRLVDAFGEKTAGICWDTGHAHMCGHDMVEDIKKMGSRLVATHIADNHGQHDEHLLPFFGTIAWEGVVKALSEEGFEGQLSLECMFFTQHLPESLKDQAIALAFAVGQRLLAIAP